MSQKEFPIFALSSPQCLKQSKGPEKCIPMLIQIAHLLFNKPMESNRSNFEQNVCSSEKNKGLIETASSDSLHRACSKTGNPYGS